MPSCRQRACVTDTCAATLDEAPPTLTGWDLLAGRRSASLASIHPHPSTLSSRPQPSAFLCGSNPTGAANMVSGVLITVASRGSPSSALCTPCLQRRRDACESRSRGTQGVPVYTSTSTACLWTTSTPGSIHAFHSCYACHAETACPSPLWAWPHARSHHRAPLMAAPSCQSLPPQTSLLFLRVRGAVNSAQTSYPTCHPYLLHTYLVSTTVRLSAPHPVHDAHGRTLLILRGTRMDPACWQPEKGCPAVGLTWVCWHS